MPFSLCCGFHLEIAQLAQLARMFGAVLSSHIPLIEEAKDVFSALQLGAEMPRRTDDRSSGPPFVSAVDGRGGPRSPKRSHGMKSVAEFQRDDM